MNDDIDFDVIGIAELIKRDVLKVPLNQREYSWKRGLQVRAFLQDIFNNARNSSQSYFLGTIVLTKTKLGQLEIADGQQRIATTTMLLAAIRDYFVEKGDSKATQSIESEYLSSYDRIKGEDIARLTLNIDDNDFFINTVVFRKHHRKPTTAMRVSHRLIEEAYTEIKEYIKSLEMHSGDLHLRTQLNEMIEYLRSKARVVKLVVENEETAYTLFETLNDRGLKTSQADLVKNHLFRLSDNRLIEAQGLWSSMKGAIETISDVGDDITIEFLRAACCVFSGSTTKREVLRKIQEKALNKTDAINTMTLIEQFSREYAAMLNSDHAKWNDYPSDVREAIKTMNILKVTQIRPLMLAVSMYFNKNETAVAFKKLVSWSVRFMVVGIRGGRLDDGYAKLAHKIHLKEIKNSADLKTFSENIVIGDAEFKSNFETASVSVAQLVRYYLRSLENTARNEPNPENIPNEKTVINLEHVMPQNLSESWLHIDKQYLETHLNRIGNLVLMQADKNNKVGNLNFEEKKKMYKESSFLLTSQIAEVNVWDIQAIENRQKILADLAVKTWAL